MAIKQLAVAGLIAITTAVAAPAAMADQYTGEIRTFGFNFCPHGWLAANGQTVPVHQYAALFSLYGHRFGGSGDNFALPHLPPITTTHGEHVPQCVALNGQYPIRP